MRSPARSAGDVQDGVRVTLVFFQFFDCFSRRQDQELDFAALGFSLQVLHDRQGAAAGTDHEAPAFPRDLLFERERRVAEVLAEFLGRLLYALAHLSAVDYHVVVIGNTVDAERAEGERLEAHGRLRQPLYAPYASEQIGRASCRARGQILAEA